MKKIRLNLDELEVSSFEVMPNPIDAGRTVMGNNVGASDRYTNCGSCETPATCSQCVTCDPSYCDTACVNCGGGGTDPVQSDPECWTEA